MTARFTSNTHTMGDAGIFASMEVMGAPNPPVDSEANILTLAHSHIMANNQQPILLDHDDMDDSNAATQESSLATYVSFSGLKSVDTRNEPETDVLQHDCLPKFVHPIFHPDNFDETECADTYKYAYPALQLASAILTHSSQLPFWQGINTNCKPGTIKDSNTGKLTPFVDFTMKAELSDGDLEAVEEFMDDLSENVMFAPAELVNEDGRCGLRKVDQTDRGDAIKKCVIEFNVDYVLIAKALSQSGSADDVRRHYFRWAIIVLHELAHAVEFFLFDEEYEIFLEDEPAAELGFAYENYLLGGIPRFLKHTDLILLRNWPCPALHEEYTNTGDKFVLRAELIDTTVQCLVANEELDKFFDPAFWQSQVSVGSKPFHLGQLTEVTGDQVAALRTLAHVEQLR